MSELQGTPSVAPAGWYLDPEGSGRERYWDGANWTNAFRENGSRAVAQYTGAVSPKSRLAALLLAIFLGYLGIHRFYVGKVGTGILMIVTIGGFGIWQLIDIIMIAVGSFNDKENRPVLNWEA